MHASRKCFGTWHLFFNRLLINFGLRHFIDPRNDYVHKFFGTKNATRQSVGRHQFQIFDVHVFSPTAGKFEYAVDSTFQMGFAFEVPIDILDVELFLILVKCLDYMKISFFIARIASMITSWHSIVTKLTHVWLMMI